MNLSFPAGRRAFSSQLASRLVYGGFSYHTSKSVNEIHVSGSRYPKPLSRDSLVSADFRREILINGAKSGLIDFQTALDAERSVLSFQDQLAQSKGQVTSNVSSLYQALGGGWTAMTGMPP